MKKKNLLIAAVFAATATIAAASDGTPSGGDRGNPGSSQQVIVTSYYNHTGYEYASRISRFHTSYVTFDFYSPVYTETYWYRYTPYTWGVSIYDDWHYYGAGATRYAWRNGFGGSYWWGYDPWRSYDPWMGYGWNSWNSPGVSYSVNYYLDRPHYHYPVAYNSWNSHRNRNYNRSVTVINNNTYNYYYGSEKRNSQQGSSSGYNPTNPGSSGRRTGYTSTGGRGSASGAAPASPAGGRTETGARDRTPTGSQGRTPTATQGRTPSESQGRTSSGTQGRTPTGTRSRNQSGTRSTSQTGTQGNTPTKEQTGNTGTAEPAGDKDKSNNGLRMGQHRRGVADPVDPADNGLPRTNNPNLNDRTDPGREQGNATRSSETRQSSADRAPAGGSQTNKVQKTVRTTSRRDETVMRQGSNSGSTAPATVRQGEEKSSKKSTEETKPAKEPKKSTPPAQRRR